MTDQDEDEAEIERIRGSLLESLDALDREMEGLVKVLDNPRRLRATSDVINRLTDDELRTLDRIVKEAHDTTGTKWVALVLLDEQNAQVVSSMEPIPSGERSQSYCQMVVASARPWAVNNTRKNNLVNRWRSTVDYDVGAYLGVPVFNDRECVGALCMFQPEPRKWTKEDEQLLMQFASDINTEMTRLAAV